MSVASAVYERTCHVCDAVRIVLKRAFLNFQRGKQLSANREIMQQMKYEFTPKGDGFLYLQQLNDRTNAEYDEAIKKLEQGRL